MISYIVIILYVRTIVNPIRSKLQEIAIYKDIMKKLTLKKPVLNATSNGVKWISQ